VSTAHVDRIFIQMQERVAEADKGRSRIREGRV